MPSPGWPLNTLTCAAALMLVAPAAEAAGPSVAVLPVQARDERNAALADLLADQVVAELRNWAVFERIVTPSELSLLLGNEQKKQLVACAVDHCALVDNELAGALGVTHLVVGNVAAVNRTVAFNLKLVDLRALREVASIIRSVDAGAEDRLFSVVPSMVPDMLRSARLVGAAAPVRAAAAPEAAGTAPVQRWTRVAGAVGLGAGGAGLLAAGGVQLAAAAVLAVILAPALRARGVPMPTLIPGGALYNPLRLSSLAALGAGGLLAVVALATAGAGGVLLLVTLLGGA